MRTTPTRVFSVPALDGAGSRCAREHCRTAHLSSSDEDKTTDAMIRISSRTDHQEFPFSDWSIF